MKDNVQTLISVPGWSSENIKREKIDTRLLDWEKRLDMYFINPIDIDSFKNSIYFDEKKFPKKFKWREFVGIYITMIDWSDLRYKIDTKNRANLLPAICLSLATWGENLQGVAEAMEDFLIPFDNQLIMSELGGYGEAYEEDKNFYTCLNLLSYKQKECIAEFIEMYFCLYKSSFSWYSEKTKEAANELVKIWREQL